MAEGGVEKIVRVEEKSTISEDPTPEITEIINIQSEIMIVWFDVLPSGQMILLACDITSSNSQLNLYSVDKKLLSQLDLPEAISAATLNDHKLIVALMFNQQLQIVNVENDNLTKGPFVETDVDPVLILNYSYISVLVLAQQRDGKHCLQIIDLTGKIEEHIGLSTDLYNPMFMRMSYDRNAVYIVDSMKGCLKIGFNPQGYVIFNYTSKDGDLFYHGLGVDSQGALYFAAGVIKGQETQDDLECVIQLSPEGQVIGHIDVRNVYPVQCIGNKMYVASFDDQKKRIVGMFYV